MANSKVMIFKHEDEVNGQPIGPLTEGVLNEQNYPVGTTVGVTTWVTLAEARRTARKLGLPLYET